jgi:hypothetical protein
VSRIDSIPGDVKFLDKIPLAQYEQRSTLKMGQTNGHKYMRPALNGRIAKGEVDPSFVITGSHSSTHPALSNLPG